MAGSSDIGPRITIKGESAFNQSIRNINNSLKEYSSELKKIDSEMGANEKSMDGLSSKGKVLNAQLDAQKSKLATLESQYSKESTSLKELGDALEKVKTEFGENSQEASKAEGAYNRQSETVSKLKVAMNEVETNINNLNSAIDKNEQEMKSLDGATDGAVQALNEIDDAADGAGDGMSELSAKMDANNLMQAADTLSGVADKLTELGSAATDAFNDVTDATTKVTGLFGETGQAAETSAKIIKNVYESGVGESMDSVANALIKVKENFGDISETDLTNLTKQALTLDETYGIDMNESLRGCKQLMTQWGLSAEDAMNLIVAGTQNGLDKTDELGDNISEYSGNFKQAGYSAEEYFQLLQNGLDGGAYNLDKVNDAINEVGNRLADGTIEGSLSIFSQSTQNVFREWQNGGATQKDVIDSIVGDIKGCKNEQEGLTMAATAFGTMGEDANLDFVKSLSSVGSEYDNVSGKAQGLLDSTTTPSQEMEANLRKMKDALAPLGEALTNLANDVLPPLTDAVGAISEWFAGLSEPIQIVIIAIGLLVVAFVALAPVIAAVSTVIGVLSGVALGPIIGIIAAVVAAVVAAIAIFKNWDKITAALGTVWETVKGVISNAVTAVGNVIKSVFSAIKNVMTTVASAVKTVVVGAFNLIKTGVTMYVNAVKTVALTAFNMIKSGITTAVNMVKSVVTTVFNGIKSVVTTASNAAKNAATTAFKAIPRAIKTALSGLAGKVRSGFSGAVSYLKNLKNQAIGWGRDMIAGFASGITQKINAVIEKVKSLAGKVKSFLHFSRPDEGPLRDYEKWMPDFMEGLAKGIKDNMNKVELAAANVGTTLNQSVFGNLDGVISGASTSYTSNIEIAGDPIVLDGKVIGQTASKYITSNQRALTKAKGGRL